MSGLLFGAWALADGIAISESLVLSDVISNLGVLDNLSSSADSNFRIT